MEKEIRIIAPEGFEIDKENSTLELIRFKEKPKVKKLPESWEELEEIGGYYIHNSSIILPIDNTLCNHTTRNIFPSKEEAEAALALAQLCQLRDRYNNGWKPDWKDNTYKFPIYFEKGGITKGNNIFISKSWPSLLATGLAVLFLFK
jgi:hypothetical protein